MHKHLIYILFGALFLFSCSSKENDGNAIARVHDAYLYQEDILNMLPERYTAQDSVLLTKNYINFWAKEQLMLKKAEININENESIEELVERYKHDILIDKYKEAVVKQYLDTAITSEDITNFYTENKAIFKLNEELIKFKYINFSNELLNPEEFEKLFRSNTKKDLDSLRSKEMQLKSLSLNDTIWVRLSDVFNRIPSLDSDDRDKILKKTKFLKKKDSLEVYLIAVKNTLKRNETAPMSYVLPTIRQMILHRRKLDLLKKIEETLVEDAINNKEFEIYENDK